VIFSLKRTAAVFDPAGIGAFSPWASTRARCAGRQPTNSDVSAVPSERRRKFVGQRFIAAAIHETANSVGKMERR